MPQVEPHTAFHFCSNHELVELIKAGFNAKEFNQEIINRLERRPDEAEKTE